MANDNTGPLVLAGLVALLLLSGKDKGKGPGATKVMGGLHAVTVGQGARMGSHEVQKGPNDKVVVAATYSVSAKDVAGNFISWPYKFFVKATVGLTEVYSNMSDPISLPKMENQVWAGAGFGFFLDPTKLQNLDKVSITVQVYGAVSKSDGTPSTSFTVLATKVHLDAILYVDAATLVAGSISTVNVTQRVARSPRPPFDRPPRRRPIFGPPPFPPPRRRPIFGPPPFPPPRHRPGRDWLRPEERPVGVSMGSRFRDPQEGLVLTGKSSPWLHKTRAPI